MSVLKQSRYMRLWPLRLRAVHFMYYVNFFLALTVISPAHAKKDFVILGRREVGRVWHVMMDFMVRIVTSRVHVMLLNVAGESWATDSV